MKLRGNLTVAIILTGALFACPFTSMAQTTGSANPTVDQARVDELTAYARAKYQEAKQQAASPQKSLEERATERPKVQLTQDEAVKRALSNNIDLNVARLNPKLADMSLESLYAAYLPTLTSMVNATSNNPLPTSLLNGGTNVTNKTNAFNFGLNKLMPWYGGNVTVSFNNGRTDTNSSFATLNPQWTTQLTATYTQPLWRNFKIDTTRSSIGQSRIARDIADVTLKSSLTNTVANTRNAYWNLAYTVAALEAARNALALSDRLVQDNQVRVEVGTLAPMDIISAQAEAATRRQNLASAEASRRTAELVLKRLIVTGTDDPIWAATIEPIDKVTTDPAKVDLEGAVKNALENRTDLVTARRNLQSNDINILYLKNQISPQLDLVGTYGSRGLGGNTFIREGGVVVGTVPGGWPDAWTMMRKVDYPNWTLQVNFSYPIGNSTQDVALARAKVTYTQAQTQLRATELQVAAEVTNAALNVESTLKRLEASTVARQLSEKKLEAEQSKFDVGMSYNYLVVQFQRDLNDARNAELRAALDYKIAQTTLERVQITP